jgi:hypothetical protein
LVQVADFQRGDSGLSRRYEGLDRGYFQSIKNLAPVPIYQYTRSMKASDVLVYKG